MPPLETNPDDARRYFQRLRSLRDHFASQFPQTDWHELSMGTSADYTVAVEEGATLVRVGTAIVGARQYPRSNPVDPRNTPQSGNTNQSETQA